MLGLALDSAGLQASAAIWGDPIGGEDGDTITSFTLLAYQGLLPEDGKADQLILVVEQLLDTTGLGYRDLDVIAVNRGPGSFTGIRSAVALGRGLALASGRPVIGITSHDALAASIRDDALDGLSDRPRRLMIAEDARRGQVYLQSFDADLLPLSDLRAEAPDDAASELREGHWRLGGSGASLVRESLDRSHPNDSPDVVMVDQIALDARSVALAASTRLASGETPVAGFDLRPLYIRPPDAVRPKPLVSPLGQALEGQG